LIALNVVATPLGAVAMQLRPGCCAPDNRNAERNREMAAASTLSAARDEPTRSAASAFLRRGRAALSDFLSAFRTFRAYRLSWLMGFVGSLYPFGIFMFYWCEAGARGIRRVSRNFTMVLASLGLEIDAISAISDRSYSI
jgi:hypothetical protein